MSKKLVKTRSEIDCPIFGAPKKFALSSLPTISDVVKHILHIRHLLQDLNSGKQPAISEVFGVVSKDVENIWKTASIPTVSNKRVKELLKANYDEYLKLIRYPVQKRTQNYKNKVESFKNTAINKLFDISNCKCTTFTSCSCIKTNKVPELEQLFLVDQRNERKMIITGIDKQVTQKNIEKLKRQEKSQLRFKDYYSETSSQPKKNRTSSSHAKKMRYNDEEKVQESHSLDAGDISDKLLPKLPAKPAYNTMKLPQLSKICDRYGVSNRSAAAIATAALQDFGLVSIENTNLIVDKNKLRRARDKTRKDLQSIERTTVQGLYFDGRKDKTLVIDKLDGRSHRRVAVKEHIAIVSEPGSKYFGHTTPRIGTGQGIADSIINYCNDHGSDLREVVCIGCDGTATNTGWKYGAIRCIELRLKRPLQWFICQLHANELPLRHLFINIDGRTTGPQQFSGPIGKQLENCVSLPVQNYQPITGNVMKLEAKIVEVLSTEQKYLYQICHAVSEGTCSVELANRQPGKLAHSRWLTLANRILRLYVGCSEPTEDLRVLVSYIVKVYAPVWFHIKREPSCSRGPHHVLKLIQYSRCFTDKVKSIIDPVIQRNAFFAHPENLLLAMISDQRSFVKELGLRKILAARNNKPASVRIYKVPKINFAAEDYIDLIYWADTAITSPPILEKLPNAVVSGMIDNEELRNVVYASFPCHTQAVERCVKMITEASGVVVGHDARDGLIRAKLQSRAEIQCFENKAKYGESLKSKDGV